VPPALERRVAAGTPSWVVKLCMSTCVSYHAGHTGAAAGLDLSWDGLVAFRDESPEAAARVAAAAAAPVFNGRCGIDGCKRVFSQQQDLIAHQEGPSHLAIPYYCPLTAEHCPVPPALERREAAGPDSWVATLSQITCVAITPATQVRLRVWTCSWDGLVAFRDESPGAAAAVLAAAAAAPRIQWSLWHRWLQRIVP